MGDVIDEVLKDHEEIKKLLAKVESASGKAKEAKAFLDFLRTPPAAAVFRDKGLDPA